MSLKATTKLASLQQRNQNRQPTGGNLTMIGKSQSARERSNSNISSSNRMESRLNHYHEIIPLQQYPYLLRLDVLPFLIMYGVLMALDSGLFLQSNEVKKWTHLVLFPLTLGAHVALFLACQWNISIQAKIGYKQCDKLSAKHGNDIDKWTHCLVKPPSVAAYETSDDLGEVKSKRHNSNKTVASVGRVEIVPVQMKEVKTKFGVGSSYGPDATPNIKSTKVATISYEERVFRCCIAKESSLPLGSDEEMDSIWHEDANPPLQSAPKSISMDRDSTDHNPSCSSNTRAVFHRLHYPVDLPLSFYTHRWIGHSFGSLKAARRVYSNNQLLIHLPPFMDLLSQQLLAPFFLFQLLCVLLWCLDEYWYYALFTLFTLVLFECTVAHSRLKNLQRLRETLRPPFGVWVFRGEKENKNGKKQQKWRVVSSQELVVGDIISLSPTSSSTEDGTHIPADLLLLRGNAVLNEAMLTGESIPQMKEPIDIAASALNHDDGAIMEPYLDIEDSTFKRAILFGGTVLMNSSSSATHDNVIDNEIDEDSQENCSISRKIPPSPEGDCIALVLRTGFDTQQGSLLRTMVHTSTKSQNDGVNTKDTFMFIVILLLCAVMSSGYVLHHGWSDPNRNRFKLILHVIIIITSVVPPELPMELSLAVTSSLADLVRRCAVYCTEPFRIPLAGMVDTCCFDKTGTLTSDEMVMRGVRFPIASHQNKTLKMSETLITPKIGNEDSGEDENAKETLVPYEVLRVLVGCQSLSPGTSANSNYRDSTSFIGDPLEKAVLKATGWRLVSNDTVAPSDQIGLRSDDSKWIHILHRFAFTSKLKRMSVIAQELGEPNHVWALSKGAPETLKGLLDPLSIPETYDSVSKYHMSLGQRVLAMGYKKGTKSQVTAWKKGGRQSLERNLTFAGFLVLDCPLKPDSKKVIKELRSSGHHTVMITGDAIGTAAEVARQVGIIKAKGNSHTYELRETVESRKNSHQNKLDARFVFVPLTSNDDENLDSEKCIAYSPSNLSILKDMLAASSIAAICVTGDTLTKIAINTVNKKMRNSPKSSGQKVSSLVDPKTVLLHPDAQSALQALVPLISVFARHAPRQKEAVIAAFNGAGRITLMCGDGTNDVGALKMSHCGISIISVPDIEAKQRDAIDDILRLQNESKCKKKKKKKSSQSKSKTKTLEERLQILAEAEEELNNVALGDASVASPFTSRATSIKCTKDVLQRGRCTLVTMMQIYKILGVNCLVNALVLSSLHLVGAKQGDTQLTVVGLVVAGLFFFVTKSQPLNKLSPQRPPSTVLCPQVLLSVAVQFLVHFVCIMAITYMSKCYLDPYDPSLVPDGHFNPNTLNSATFIMTVLATVNTFVVNYCGRPFMEDLRENKMMVRALQVCYAVLFASAFEVFPPLNDLMQLAPFPIDGDFMEKAASTDGLRFHLDLLHSIVGVAGFKTTLCSLMLADTFLAYMLEKVLIKAFTSQK